MLLCTMAKKAKQTYNYPGSNVLLCTTRPCHAKPGQNKPNHVYNDPGLYYATLY